MKTLVLGGAGMLGHKLVQRFNEAGIPVECTIRGSLRKSPLVAVDLFRQVPVHERVDTADLSQLRKRLQSLRPEVIVNCVGVIKQREEAQSAIACISTNALLPHLLAEWAKDWNGKLIHFSTDCVFSGKRGMYAVDEISDAEDLYGRSKYMGEVHGENALTLRTSIIGRELSHFQSLIEWFIAQDGKTVQGFNRAIYTGMTTDTMADLLIHVLTHHPGLSGLHHAVSEPIDKHRLLTLTRDALGLNTEIVPNESFYCDRSLAQSGLNEEIGFVPPDWRDQIQRLAKDQTPYKEWR